MTAFRVIFWLCLLYFLVLVPITAMGVFVETVETYIVYGACIVPYVMITSVVVLDRGILLGGR